MQLDPQGVAPEDLSHAGAVVDKAIEYMLGQNIAPISVASALLGGALGMLARSMDDRAVAQVLRNALSSVESGELAEMRGPQDAARRLPGNAHFTFPGCEGDSLLYLLDSAGVEASTGSACQAGVPRPSHVLLAMGVGEDDARGALRFSLGHSSSSDDVAALLAALPAVLGRARAAGLAAATSAGVA